MPKITTPLQPSSWIHPEQRFLIGLFLVVEKLFLQKRCIIRRLLCRTKAAQCIFHEVVKIIGNNIQAVPGPKTTSTSFRFILVQQRITKEIQ